MENLFTGPKLKAERAKHHIEELKRTIASYISCRPFSLATEQMGDIEMCRITILSPPPKQLPAIIGDVVHNLRAALDLLACDAARLNGRTPNGTYFPFPHSESEADDEIKDKLRKLPVDVRSLVKSLGPWDPRLRRLHALDIIDKHRMILPTFSSVDVGFGKLTMGFDETERSYGSNVPSYSIANDIKAAEDKLNASINFNFPVTGVSGDYSPHAEVTSTLQDHADRVNEIIEKFEQYYKENPEKIIAR